MSSPLKSLVEGVHAATAWVRRAEARIEQAVKSHPEEMKSATKAALMPIPILPLGKLIWNATDLGLKSANRFANSVEQAFGETMAYNFGTSTLVDMPRF